MAPKVGYSYLCDALNLSAFEPRRPAILASVKRILFCDSEILVPLNMAPKTNSPLEHVLFAMKHEGINLQVLAEVLPKILPQEMMQAIAASPQSAFVRKVCFLWEYFAKTQLEGLPSLVANSPAALLFDPTKYITGKSVRSGKWRVDFNGLGSMAYCATVIRTKAIDAGIASDVLGRAAEFIDKIGLQKANRASAWAYLSETQSSFAIEQEKPSPKRAEAFVALLREAHRGGAISEEYLTTLHAGVLPDSWNSEVGFRNKQNWLRRGGLRGPSSVSYVPPAPELLHHLMPEWENMANILPTQVDPIIAASVSSFGFVYLHPFMDGNGRLSRFLFHKALCQSGKLEDGRLLPVSAAMKKNEDQYLAALESFSSPARKFWDVALIDGDRFECEFKGSESIYRYWDATACAEFGLKMSSQALDVHLRQETNYLTAFDAVHREINEQFDVQGNMLHELICGALDQNGTVSNNKRKKYVFDVKPEVFAAIEAAVKQAMPEQVSDESSSPD